MATVKIHYDYLKAAVDDNPPAVLLVLPTYDITHSRISTYLIAVQFRLAHLELAANLIRINVSTYRIRFADAIIHTPTIESNLT